MTDVEGQGVGVNTVVKVMMPARPLISVPNACPPLYPHLCPPSQSASSLCAPSCAPSQCARHFLILDNSAGIQLYTYEGRQLCNPKFQGLRTELLNREMVRP